MIHVRQIPLLPLPQSTGFHSVCSGSAHQSVVRTRAGQPCKDAALHQKQRFRPACIAFHGISFACLSLCKLSCFLLVLFSAQIPAPRPVPIRCTHPAHSPRSTPYVPALRCSRSTQYLHRCLPGSMRTCRRLPAPARRCRDRGSHHRIPRRFASFSKSFSHRLCTLAQCIASQSCCRTSAPPSVSRK